jgi:hypothetical protein
VGVGLVSLRSSERKGRRVVVWRERSMKKGVRSGNFVAVWLPLLVPVAYTEQ